MPWRNHQNAKPNARRSYCKLANTHSPTVLSSSMANSEAEGPATTAKFAESSCVLKVAAWMPVAQQRRIKTSVIRVRGFIWPVCPPASKHHWPLGKNQRASEACLYECVCSATSVDDVLWIRSSAQFCSVARKCEKKPVMAT